MCPNRTVLTDVKEILLSTLVEDVQEGTWVKKLR